ncbi:hypothetical protein LPJ53_004985 [Coemansia erecta]|uniref:NmrA-like domain-containing protein n=1 Tax=Coemansia erecta TaxID=147472 RepID=A0A9W7XXU9_9FUNG|nr:hypothetical protein LPJ53_004985 [Coemansia erecta]
MTQLVAVVGATGLQGGSVVKVLHASGKYRIRALTRNPESSSAKSLEQKYPGIEIVRADLDSPESLRQAFRGADIVFGVTQFFQKDILEKVENGDTDAEFTQGKAIIDAAIDEGVQSMVLSSLPSMNRISCGKYTKVLHFEGKHKVEEYLLSKGDEIRGYPVHAGSYMQNYIGLSRRSAEDNAVEFSFVLDPSDKLPLTDVESDFGKVVAYILEHPEECLGKPTAVCTGYFEAQDMVKAFTEVTGTPARYVQIPYECMCSENLTQMAKGLREFNIFDGITDFAEYYEKKGVRLTTPAEFWRNSGWTGLTE